MSNTQQKFLSRFQLPSNPSIPKLPNLILFPKQGILRGYSGGARQLLEHGTQVDISDDDQYSTRSLDSNDFTISNSSQADARKMSKRRPRRHQPKRKSKAGSAKRSKSSTAAARRARAGKAKIKRRKTRSSNKKLTGRRASKSKGKTIHKRKSTGKKTQCNRFKSIL